jgi:hypothetical protein
MKTCVHLRHFFFKVRNDASGNELGISAYVHFLTHNKIKSNSTTQSRLRLVETEARGHAELQRATSEVIPPV